MSKNNRYIPALSFNWLTPFYDRLISWGMRELAIKRRLIEQAKIQPGQHILDLGCGTGTLTIMVKQKHPEAEVFGVDGDPEILAIGREKAAKAGTQLTLEQGMAYQLPYPDESFDHVLTSLVLHHISHENKQRTFAEVRRVLRPGGELHILDFGTPRGFYGKLANLLTIWLEETGDNVKGLLPAMMQEAGLKKAEELAWVQTIFGTLSFYRGHKP